MTVLAGGRIYFVHNIVGRLIVAPALALATPNHMLGECGWTCAVDNTFSQPDAKA